MATTHSRYCFRCDCGAAIPNMASAPALRHVHAGIVWKLTDSFLRQQDPQHRGLSFGEAVDSLGAKRVR